MSAKIRILRDGNVVGELTTASAQLVGEDAELNALWAHWQTEGFRVLGPASGPVPEGALCAVALLTIRPAADNLGLVAFELSHHGYELKFEETPPADTPAPDGGDLPGGHQRAFFSLPVDRSLAAFKTWIKEITAGVGGSTTDDPIRDAEEIWVRDWTEFWQKFDAAAQRQSTKS